MNKKEILFVIAITVICYIWYFTCKCWGPTFVLNTVLLSFYILFVIGKLPVFFYSHGESPKSRDELICLYGCIIFLVCCWLSSIFPVYTKYIGRVGLIGTLLLVVGFLISTYYRRLCGTLSKDKFLKNHTCYFRVVLVVLTNVYMLPMCVYNYSAVYNKNGRLISKEILDGLSMYKTEYVDSISAYVTHAEIYDSSDRDIRYVEYNVIYDKYPDKIDRIDTIKIVRRK